MHEAHRDAVFVEEGGGVLDQVKLFVRPVPRICSTDSIQPPRGDGRVADLHGTPRQSGVAEDREFSARVVPRLVVDILHADVASAVVDDRARAKHPVAGNQVGDHDKVLIQMTSLTEDTVEHDRHLVNRQAGVLWTVVALISDGSYRQHRRLLAFAAPQLVLDERGCGCAVPGARNELGACENVDL